jgi:selenocysteine lyase/cysteine desulfurase
VDAIQSLGVIPMDVKKYKIDFLSADAHKWLLGPEGIGIFYCKEALAGQLAPPLIGWKCVKNEFGFESPDFQLKSDALRFEEGSSNVMGILGLGAALDLLMEVGIERIEERVLTLGDTIIKEAEARGHLPLTPKKKSERGGNVTFTGYFDPIRVKDALLKKGIMVNVRGGGLRVSPHFYNTEQDLERFFESLDDIVLSTGSSPLSKGD